MADRDVPLTTVLSLLFFVVVFNIYLIALAFGMAAVLANAWTTTELSAVFGPISGALIGFATMLIYLRTTILRIVDDLAD